MTGLTQPVASSDRNSIGLGASEISGSRAVPRTSGSALAARRPHLPRLGILNDYVRIPYANGSSFASQFLYREFTKLGSEVTVVGPRDPKAVVEELPPEHICLSSVPFRHHPGVHLSMPDRAGLRQLADARLSLLVAQTGSALLDAGVWLRRNHQVPLVCVNTIHLPAVYDVLLPQAVHNSPTLHRFLQQRVVPWVERANVAVYNSGDALVVLSEGLKAYWRDLGVTVPIHVIPRSVDPSVFDAPVGEDPFPRQAKRGKRLLVVCRHTREKNVERLLNIFAQHVASRDPEVTLTLVGDGPDHDHFKGIAEKLGVATRCFFPGEISLPDIPTWYRHADVFVYTSLSETYGQVVSEALWCGLPVVAFSDGKGVSDQVDVESDGYLIDPLARDADSSFGARIVQLLSDPEQLQAFSTRAENKARRRSDPGRCVAAYQETFAQAQEHCMLTARPQSFLQRVGPLVHMAALHSLLAVLGCIRPPATVNRHGRLPPRWESPKLPQTADSLKSVPSAA